MMDDKSLKNGESSNALKITIKSGNSSYIINSYINNKSSKTLEDILMSLIAKNTKQIISEDK